MARVTVAVNVRDMTRGDLRRIRNQMDGLTRSVNRFTGNMSQRNLVAMQRQFATLDGRLQQLRGHIPGDEFARLTTQVRRFGDALNTTLGPVSGQRLGVIRSSLRDIDRDLNRMTGRPREVRITARDDTAGGLRSASRRITRWALGPLRGIGGLISGTLRDGIGQGLVGAFRSPTFGAILVAGILAAVSMLGAAIAGILVLAIGGAFVGLGVAIALQAEGVKKRWTETLNGLKPIFADAAKPMIPVIDHAREKFNEVAREFAPHFKEALERATPTLNGFIDSTKQGLRNLGQHAWDDLQTAFRTFLTAFGPEWEDFLKELGKSLGALARTVTEHSTEMAMALRGVLGVINFLIDAINFFANAWVFGVGLAIDAINIFFKVMAFVTDSVLGFFGDLLDAAANAFSWVPELGGRLEDAQESFGRFRDEAVGRLQDVAREAENYGNTLDYNNRTRKLQVDIDSWMAQLNTAKKQLESVPPERQAELKAKITDLENKIAEARRQLNSIDDKTVYVRTILQTFRQQEINDMNKAHGGVIGHVGRAATGGARSSMTLVGEHGPEIVNLAPGSHVRSNPDTRRMLRGDGGGSGGATFVFKSSGSRADDLLLELMRDAIHQRGGNPVTVLGG